MSSTKEEENFGSSPKSIPPLSPAHDVPENPRHVATAFEFGALNEVYFHVWL